MWQTFEAQTANALWQDILNTLKNTPPCQNSRSGSTREISHAAICLTDPTQKWITSRRPAINPAFALAEMIWIINGRRDSRFISYFNRSLRKFSGDGADLNGAYGHRLRHHFGIDQLERAYQTLRQNPDSRQVVLQIWDPVNDLPLSTGAPRDADIPCNTQSYIKIRNGKLEWMQLMRSNDIFRGVPYNIVQFTSIQEVLAGWLGIEVGSYHHLSDSLHAYETDWDKMSVAESRVATESESLALPKEESDSAFEQLGSLVEAILDPSKETEQLQHELRRKSFPVSYQNIGCLLVAEGLRRRRQHARAAETMMNCSNKTYNLLWKNWCDRISGNINNK